MARTIEPITPEQLTGRTGQRGVLGRPEALVGPAASAGQGPTPGHLPAHRAEEGPRTATTGGSSSWTIYDRTASGDVSGVLLGRSMPSMSSRCRDRL